MFVAPELDTPEVLDSFLASRPQMLIGGQWVDAASGLTIDVEDPSTGQVIAQVPAGDEQDVDRAVRAAHAALAGLGEGGAA